MMTRRFLQLSAALALGLAPFLAAHANEITVAYLHTDAQGSVVAETDEAGEVVERREYEPYGLPQEPMEGPGYTGHDHDADSGLVYMQQRYYDPLSGRFLSVDPVGVSTSNGGNFNRYWYADNNPETFVDPDGRCTGSRITNGDGSCAFGGGNTTLSAPSLSGGTMSVQAKWNGNNGREDGSPTGRNSGDPTGRSGGLLDQVFGNGMIRSPMVPERYRFLRFSGGGGDCGPCIYQHMDIEAFGDGEISERTYFDRTYARGAGALAGASVYAGSVGLYRAAAFVKGNVNGATLCLVGTLCAVSPSSLYTGGDLFIKSTYSMVRHQRHLSRTWRLTRQINSGKARMVISAKRRPPFRDN